MSVASMLMPYLAGNLSASASIDVIYD
jgi:hypothetical protein